MDSVLDLLDVMNEIGRMSRMPRKRVQHKYRAVRTERDGLKFASKKEARYYDQLKLRQRSGDVVMFLRQVRFDLPGGVFYYCDFQVFEASGDVRFVDVKGVETETFKVKRRLVESLYPVEIETA